MEQEIILNNQLPTEKIYKDRAIGVGTFLGGPIVAGYFIAENFKEFGEDHKAKLTWIIAIVSTVLLFGGLMFAPFVERIPNSLFPLIYTGLVYSIVRVYQGNQIDSHITKGGEIHSWWRVIGVSIIGLLITLIVVFAVAFMTIPSEKTKTYGTTKNEIMFPEGNISEDEVDSLAEALRKTGYFNDEMKSYAYAEKSGNTYEISIVYNSPDAINSEVVEYYTLTRNDMQEIFPNNKIIFKLVVGSIDNVVKRIE